MESSSFRSICAFLTILLLGCFVLPGGHRWDQGSTVVGPNASLDVGDYVSNVSGLNSYIVFFIEIPSGLPNGINVYVSIYDADIGDTYDQSLDTSGNRTYTDWDSQVIYYLDDPNGDPYDDSGPIGEDPADCETNDCYDGKSGEPSFTFTIAASDVVPGHWRLRVFMDPGDGSTYLGNDINYFEISAYTDPIVYSYNLT